jgi:hypothetical protein
MVGNLFLDEYLGVFEGEAFSQTCSIWNEIATPVALDLFKLKSVRSSSL